MAMTTTQYITDWRHSRDALQQAVALNQLRVIVPTMNAEDHIEIVLSYYKDIGLPITVVVDAKSTDATEEKSRGLAHELIRIENPSSVVEGMIQTLSKQTGAKWVLRLDDDELPSLAMLAFVAQTIESGQLSAVGFPRKQCAVSHNGRLRASRLHSASLHTQWRLYRPDQVQYTSAIHTPGFIPPPGSSVVAPDQCFMVHLDWSLHSYQSRLAKIERYDQHTAQRGSQWRSFYLFEEDKQHGAKAFETVQSPEFHDVARRIQQRFPNNCIEEPTRLQNLLIGLKDRLTR
jgi:hypothetical protein